MQLLSQTNPSASITLSPNPWAESSVEIYYDKEINDVKIE